MAQGFIARNLRQALLNFGQEPLVVIEELFERFPCQRFGVAATSGGDIRQSGLQGFRRTSMTPMLAQRRFHPRRRERHGSQPYAGGVENRISQRRGHWRRCRLPGAH